MRPFFMLVFFRNLTLFFLPSLTLYIKVFTRLDTCRPTLRAGRFSVIV